MPDTMAASAALHLGIYVRPYHPRSGTILNMLTSMGIFSFDYRMRGLLGVRTELDEGGRNQFPAGLSEAGSLCSMRRT